MTRASLPLRVSSMLVLAGLPLAVGLGALIAIAPARGLGITLALAMVPIIMLDLRIALALYVGVIFVERLPMVSVGPNAMGLALIVAWAGLAGERARRGLSSLSRRHTVLVAGVLGLLVWAALSTIWASDQARVGSALFELVLGVVMFFVYATGVTTQRTVVTVVVGFLGGAVLSVTIGLIGSGLQSSLSAIQTATQFEGRLSGGSGDPNYLAAGLVPAMALGGGLLAVVRGRAARFAILVGIVICAVGLAATQSRGGLVALGAAAIAALVVARGHRHHVVAILCMLVAVAGGWLMANPSALQRIVTANDGGDGRAELWAVAWSMAQDHPVVGVGLNNFVRFSRDYAGRPGERRFGELLTEKPVLVHNAYLQLLAETGIVGLLLLALIIAAAVRATWLAGRRFERLRRPDMATLARTLVIAQVGALAAAFFLSNLGDKRTWFLLALGPVLLATASRPGKDAPA